MLTVRVEKLSELTVIACKGRIIHSDSVFKLRDVVSGARRRRLSSILLKYRLSAAEVWEC